MTIAFDSIPSSIRKPGRYLEYNTSLAVRTLPANKQRMLIVAQRLAAGTVAALTPTQVFSDADAASYFGGGSMAHLMVRAAIKANPNLDLTVCALDDAVGAAASGTITIAGTATTSGTLAFYIGSKKIEVAIAKGDTAESITTKLDTAVVVNNYLDVPIYMTINSPTVLACRSRNLGTIGNQIDLYAEVTAAGVTATIVPMSGGTVDPNLSTALAKVVAEQYHIIATPYNAQADLLTLRDHLNLVSGPMEQRPGVGVYAIDTALASATSLAAWINSGRIVGVYLRGTKSISYEMAAAFAAVLASEEDPARPLNTLELVGIAAPPVNQRLSRTEQESCLANGVAPLEVGPGEKVQIVRAITTYLLNAAGSADISLLDVTTIRTLDYVRKACRERIAQRFGRSKLSSRTPKRARAELLDVLRKLEELEIVENVAANEEGLITERDGQDPNRLNAAIPADVVNGLHVFAGRIDLIL